MSHAMFEPENAPFFEGRAFVEVQDPTGVAPATIIQTDHGWQVNVSWRIDGNWANTVIPTMSADWKVSVYAESLGAGAAEEKQIGDPMSVPFSGGSASSPTRREYDVSVSVPASTADPAKGLAEGAYRLVTIILAENAAGTPLEFAAFVEGPVIQQYDATP